MELPSLPVDDRFGNDALFFSLAGPNLNVFVTVPIFA
jgi:hypothetical protein